ncbi:MAG: MFS transporter [Pseudomonadales bacterium]|nr:MFS transporter [Pseudomonadales bacterium]
MKQASGTFYGYYLAGLAFALGFIGGGIYLYSRGVFVRDQIIDFGASRTEISLVFTSVSIVSACFAPALGFLLDRYPIRNVMLVGTIFVVIGFALLSQVENLIQFSVIAALFLGFGMGAIGTTANTKLMVNWFNRRRGFALGVAIMGYSAAGTVMAPIALYMLNSLGWRVSYLVFAGVVLFIVLPAVFLLVRQRPSDLGLAPDGDPVEEAATESPPAEQTADNSNRWQRFRTELTVYTAFMQSVPFWGVVFTFGLMAGTFGGFNVHLFLYYTELGIDEYWATTILSFTSAIAIASKPMFGALIDRVNPRIATMMSCGCCLAAMLCFSAFTHIGLLFLAGALFGLGFGGMIPVRAAIISRIFSTDQYARAYGSLRLCMFPMTITWMPLIGYIYDTQGSYLPAFNLFAVLFTVAVLVAFRLIPQRLIAAT